MRIGKLILKNDFVVKSEDKIKLCVKIYNGKNLFLLKISKSVLLFSKYLYINKLLKIKIHQNT